MRLDSKPALAILALLHSAVTCLSLIKVASFQSYIHFSGDTVWVAVVVAAAFSAVSLLFAVARFSFGYFIGFYFYTMILGFLWIDVFSQYGYLRLHAGISAALSLVLILLPTLFIGAPLRPTVVLSKVHFEHLLTLILVLSGATIAIASSYNFRFVAISHIYDYRDTIEFPAALRYLVGWISSTLLPFAFACYWLLGCRWRAMLVLVLLLLLYPVTLTKFAFFTPIWIIALAILSGVFAARTSTLLTLFLPMLAGVILISISVPYLYDTAIYAPADAARIRMFDIINIRMMATASSALDIYNHFFASHPPTWFCQISLLKPLMNCYYQEPLAVVMQNTYGFGNLNASLFATEGVASVGIYLAPLIAFASGLVLALGNRAAAGLPPRFVLMSSGVLPHVLLNVPLSVALLTHGLILQFLLWYVMPRDLFEPEPWRRAS
ncbi:hypothetical protein [Bradyrhizobium sp. KB893862 SZCCT0404]|uniref:hypothetical protein n=1 Tax=Bradyrhizobium sp. KB893862 SZCCT0404 TaxID=2807672 RepID=UPI002013A8A5|nr:hypothetical protein [Bradyrhizobium sp. KB893862 SZCCT0404]